MKCKSQTEAVLQHLQTKGSITSMDAITKYGATRLSAIIFNLRKLGYKIETHMIHSTTRYGNACMYAEYRLKEDK